MGLHMYAARRTNVENGDHQPEETKYSIRITRGGKPVLGIEPNRITSIEERVMEWHNAGHIHEWFVQNVQDGKNDREAYRVSRDHLSELLSVCEKVLNGSHLVPATSFASELRSWRSPDRDALRNPAKAIKNINVAYKLLPIPSGWHSNSGQYDEAYLEAVEETRSWILRMFADRQDGIGGDIYFSSRW